MDYGDEIEEWRKRVIAAIEAHGGTRDAISRGAGLGSTFLRDLIDRRQVPTVGKLKKLCDYLGVKLEDIFSEEPKSSEDIAYELQNTALQRAFRQVAIQPRHIQKAILEGLQGQIRVALAKDKQPVKAKPREKPVPVKGRKRA